MTLIDDAASIRRALPIAALWTLVVFEMERKAVWKTQLEKGKALAADRFKAHRASTADTQYRQRGRWCFLHCILMLIRTWPEDG